MGDGSPGELARQRIKPRFLVVKLLIDGATCVISLSFTPNQRASVAAYWSTEVLGM